MLDRYENKELELDLENRISFKFMKCSEEVYAELTRVHDSKQVKIKDKLPAIKSALDDASKLWRDSERVRPKFMVPDSLLSDYLFAKNRYNSTSLSPEIFRQKDEQQRLVLEKERVSLAEKIQIQEVEFAQAEEERLQFINTERARLNAELSVLMARKVRYQARAQSSSHCIWVTSAQKKLPDVLKQMSEVEKTIKSLPDVRSKFLKDKRDDLSRLHKRRWDIEKALNSHDEAGGNNINRWINAIDNAEVVMIVRRMDIEKAAERYYAECSLKVAYTFFNVYKLLMDLASQYHGVTVPIKEKLQELTRYAEVIYCPAIAERSIDTLYKIKKDKAEEKSAANDHQSINKQGYRYG